MKIGDQILKSRSELYQKLHEVLKMLNIKYTRIESMKFEQTKDDRVFLKIWYNTNILEPNSGIKPMTKEDKKKNKIIINLEDLYDDSFPQNYFNRLVLNYNKNCKK